MWFDRVVIGTERRTVWIGNEDFSDGDDNVIQQQQAQALPVGDDNEDDEDHEANNNNNNGGGGQDPLEVEGEPEPERLEERPIRVELSAFAEVLPRGCDEMQFHCCITGHIFWNVFKAPSPPCLRVLVALRSLDMFECRGIDAYAVAALSQWLSDPTASTRLERLKIQYGFVEDGDGAGDDEGNDVRIGIADPILEALGSSNTTLRELTIRTGHLPLRIGPGAAKAIGQSPTLQRLTLSGLYIPSEDVTVLARCLQGNDARLQHLELASAATEIPYQEFYELVQAHNWHLESVQLAGISDASQRRLDHWTTTVNPVVRRVHDGWETHVVSWHRLWAAETSRVTTSTTTSQYPTSSSSFTSSSSPVLKLLPVALHSLQSKPDLTYKLLRGRHLEELVAAHWLCRSQRDRHQPPTKPPPKKTNKSDARKNENMNFQRNNVTSSECRTPRNRRSGSGGGGGGGVDRTRSIPRHPTPRR